MDDVQEAVQIEANLTALPDNPTNEQILQAVKGFRNASVPIAMYRLLEAAGGGGGGATPGAVIGTKVSFTFADFTDHGDAPQLGRTPVAYELAAGEHLLFAGMLITESFDDSGGGSLFISSLAAAPFGQLVGPAPPFAQGASVANDGLYSIFSRNVAGDWTNQVRSPSQAETPPFSLYLFQDSMIFDGTAGAIEATFYTCTPTT